MKKTCKRKVYVNPYLQHARCENLRSCIRDYRIMFYLLDEGEAIEDRLFSIHLMTKVVTNILPKDSPEFRKIKSAINVIDECNSNGKWRKDYVQTIANALDIVLDVYPALAADKA